MRCGMQVDRTREELTARLRKRSEENVRLGAEHTELQAELAALHASLDGRTAEVGVFRSPVCLGWCAQM
jgi:hypothetical protein